jgi:uncharacterized protein YecE (DUF72 family)
MTTLHIKQEVLDDEVARYPTVAWATITAEFGNGPTVTDRQREDGSIFGEDEEALLIASDGTVLGSADSDECRIDALAQALEPACAGLGPKLGTLVFQLSPLPWNLLRDTAAPALERLEAFWSRLMPAVPAGVDVALEVRDPGLLQPALARQLRAHGVRYCLGLHDRMPPIDAQLDMLRALWPGNLVCRWNLQRGLRYTQAREAFTPFDRLQAPDVATRTQLARVIAATLRTGHRACVTINNKAEGSAPLSVFCLAESVLEAVRSADRLTAGDPATPATDR